jgi:hypothetical protein
MTPFIEDGCIGTSQHVCINLGYVHNKSFDIVVVISCVGTALKHIIEGKINGKL